MGNIVGSESYLVKPLSEWEEYQNIINSISKSITPISVLGPSDSERVHIAHSICTNLGTKGIYIANNELAARKIHEDFSFFLGDLALLYPSRELTLYDIEATSHELIYQRINVLFRMIQGDYKIIVTSPEAIIQKLISYSLFKESIITFNFDSKVDLANISQKLISIGYERGARVEGKGQFSIRGGIIDIFPVNLTSAVRIELFDDIVDSIRLFDAGTQRSTEALQSIIVAPARELIYSPLRREQIISDMEEDLNSFINGVSEEYNEEHKKSIRQRVLTDIENINSSYYFAGMDRLIPFIVDNPGTLLDYFDSNAIVFMDEIDKVKQRIENALFENTENCLGLLEKARITSKTFELLFKYEDIEKKSNLFKRVVFNTFNSTKNNVEFKKSYNLLTKTMTPYEGHMELLVEDIKKWREAKSRVVILSGTKAKGERLLTILKDSGLECAYMEDYNSNIQPGDIFITHGSLCSGFEYPLIDMIVVSDKEIFGDDKKGKKYLNKKRGKKLDAFTDLNVGDFVVHENHGMGVYVGIHQLCIDNIKKDYLKIKYQGDDFLYIPTNQLDLIQKYIGSDDKKLKLNRLGGSDWSKAKKKVKESLMELAGELIKLYAKREADIGIAFSKDTIWQKQFEEMFPYEETPDQLKCIEEIKADMEILKPMDRLLCGDVGYGKTEVALRAVFKAVMDGKQVAYLVPTTILAQQQYNSLKERVKDFPIRVELLSRFRSLKEQKIVLKDLKAGLVDVVVGTHRIIQKDMEFKDLGLLVIDEEQRFGVMHKEKIKNLKANIDVLTLTATPIPRTLHMSLAGIRDISIIEDPPEERYPVQTYVMEYNADVIRDAILRELARNGQVFYLSNSVKNIDHKVAEINKLVPECRVMSAHGQMAEGKLEEAMKKFINKDFDVLVCTTIIESGLDMPNVNTIIVEDSDKMGLAQLYQIRGRVGRSNRVAYAYITYRRDKILSEIAEKRLKAIREFTEFGSGFKIAMRDLEIRGAGNLIGKEQHGQMEAVGYDMYCKLLDEAICELKGEVDTKSSSEITIDINVDAYIENEYIVEEIQKIEMYKKIASIVDIDDVVNISDELLDRYGNLPTPVKNLIDIAYIKTLAKDCGFISVQEKNESIIFQCKGNEIIDFELIGKIIDKYKRRVLFSASNTPYLTFKIKDIERSKLLENIKIVLQDVKKLKNP